MDTASRPTYHHGNLRAALIAAARELLDSGGVDAIGLRETARRVGVSATATYRHFADKDDLIAAVATEGFEEFARVLAAACGETRLAAMGLAYVNFALEHSGLFNLMFGPQLRRREHYPDLAVASNAAFSLMVDGVKQCAPLEAPQVEAAALSAWSRAHGFACLALDEIIPRDRVSTLARTILAPAS